MNLPFLQHSECVATRLAENTDPHGVHMECLNSQGVVFARATKVYKKGGLFGLFNQDSNVHGEVKDAQGQLLFVTTSYRGDTKRECKVEIQQADGTPLGNLYDANWGADFELPDGTLVGKARRPVRPDNEPASEPTEVVHTFTDAADQVVGTCDRRYPSLDPEKRDALYELLSGSVNRGQRMQFVTLHSPVAPVLHTFAFLFPVLQNLRFSRSG